MELEKVKDDLSKMEGELMKKILICRANVLFDLLSHAFADKCPDSLRFFCKVLFLSFYMITKNLTRSLRHYQLRLFN